MSGIDLFARPWRSFRTLYNRVPRRQGAAYIGWAGHSNLGDEAMFDVTRELLAPIPVYVAKRGWSLASACVRESPRLAILGGGTLVGAPLYRRQLAGYLDRGVPAAVFSTGVRRVDFWRAIGDQGTELESWHEILKACRHVGVRGPDSVASLAAIGIEAELLGDLAAQFVQPDGFHQPLPKTLGVNVGRSRGALWGREEHLFDGLVEFLRERLAEGWQVEYFVVWPSDVGPTRRVVRRVGQRHATIHRVYHSVDDYLQRVRRVQMFLGVKLHSAVLAMCAGVPSILVEYRPKCLDFMKSVGMEEFSLRSDRITPETLGAMWESLQGRGQEAARHAVSRLGDYRDRQHRFAARLSEGRRAD